MEFFILDTIQSIRNPFLDIVVPLITRLGDGGILWFAMMVVLLIIPKTRKTGIIMGVALLFDLLICNLSLKPLVARIRPCDINQSIELLIARPLDYSFPSGHTAFSFSATFALLFSKHRKIGWPALFVAILIALSRLYLYVHYPSDVLAGVVIGALCGFLGNIIVNKVSELIKRRKNKNDFGEKKMSNYSYVSLMERPELKEQAANWFHEKWYVPTEAYLECMEEYLQGESKNGWYLCMDGDKIVAGLGVIDNDFHERKDLSPNVCAVYTEEEYRKKGIAGVLLNMVVEDMRAKGVSPVYLVTDHTGFYERYGWEFLCMVQPEDEPELTRMYIHR